MGQVAIHRGEAATKGYDSTFEEMYETYKSRVFAFAYSRTGNVELAKDLTAEVFERAYAHGRSLRDQAAYTAWLFAIAKNAIMGHFRKSRRETSGMARLMDSLWVAECPKGPEESALRRDLIRQLVDCLHRLPPRDRNILLLKFDAELTNAQIGRTLGITDTNARVSVCRALARLRSVMEREEATRFSGQLPKKGNVPSVRQWHSAKPRPSLAGAPSHIS